MTTNGYKLIEPPVPKQPLVHIHADPSELGRVYQGELLICSGVNQFAHAAAALPKIDSARWAKSVKDARAELDAWRKPAGTMPGKVDVRACIEHMNDALPEDTIYTNGAGNFSGWLSRFHPYTLHRTQLAPSAGSMGFGVPAAVAAKTARRNQTVVAVSGDGDFMMNGQELATAVQYGLNIIFLVVNNSMYGTIRMHQERDYPGRISGTTLKNPDFAALARAYGAHGETVTETAQFIGALERSLRSKKPALIELVIDPNAITTSTTLDAIREKALGAKPAAAKVN
jgi:acetolactate synthase-1/2/3 large subunit